MSECEKRKTPYFLPKTAPPTKEGVEKLKRDFLRYVRAREIYQVFSDTPSPEFQGSMDPKISV